jgi:hypothetical protein
VEILPRSYYYGMTIRSVFMIRAVLVWIVWIVGGECGKQVMASCGVNPNVSWYDEVMWDNRSCNLSVLRVYLILPDTVL